MPDPTYNAKLLSEHTELLAIVRELAAVLSPYDSQDGECWFCLTPMGRTHPDDCLHTWARAFLDRHSTKGAEE
jgi:hypothetical protein